MIGHDVTASAFGRSSLRVTILASGSSGNAILIEAGGARLLLDAGLSPRRLDQRLERSGGGVRLGELTGVFVSHEHGDHAQGARALASAGLPLWATPGTARALELEAGMARALTAGEPVVVADGPLTVTPVAVPHDAAEPVAFLVDSPRGRLGVLLDAGATPDALVGAFLGCDALVIEANHDPTLLKTGPYPAALKRRIGGGKGHLSNEQAAGFVAQLATRGACPRVVVLAHLSVENNRPELARRALERALPGGVRPLVFVAPPDRPLGGFELVAPGRVRARPAGPARQLTLAFAEEFPE